MAASPVPAERPVLALADLEAFDPHAAPGARERRFRCPLEPCRDKPKRSLSLNVESGLWSCYRCGAAGKVRERWEPRERPAFAGRPSPVALARRAFGLDAPPRPAAQPGRAASAALLPELLDRCRPLAGTPGHRYLIDRGIGLALAERAGVRWVADCYGRPGVAFLLRDPAGQPVAVHVRHTAGRDDPKCHTVGDRRLGAFATPGALDGPPAPLVVCEGPVDALSLAACGVPALALVGTRAPDWLRLAAGLRPVLLALDADAEGDRAAEELAGDLGSFARSVERLRPPWGLKDWNDALQDDFLGLRDWLAPQVPAT